MSNAFQSSLELLIAKQAGGHKEVKDELITMRSALKQTMDKGITPSEMEVARAAMSAVNAADVVVDKMYAKLFG